MTKAQEVARKKIEMATHSASTIMDAIRLNYYGRDDSDIVVRCEGSVIVVGPDGSYKLMLPRKT